ncbi:LysM domain-containing protein [Gottschalkia purinilytica]|uniref:LysM domain-containing protein n=1 Tax=Gottschalkia purinilytica TaxID=1503 RepID=A0A0L0WBP5_GOTPU|nr:LysM peptidoglycan-binding domain-containing protein [Gottschalkia purinilytica]KNF08913.1 LysM domain-containing protein [Gottschalkia purinilytica]
MYIKKMRIISKTRFTIFLTLSSLILFILLSNIFNINVYSKKVDKHKEVVISDGDTVWQIAKKFNNNNEDVRIMVNRIIRANDLKNQFIKPGDTIKVPLY